ncbi:MAG TPA: CGNR zinc finger domain-containing protein [Actinomycetota bacterium]|nr:CGNR zinc finger domain-containing protein [Actinomycetota bacterium]
MNFRDYRDRAALFAEELVNSRGSISGREWLPDAGALRDFLAHHGLEAGDVTDADVEAVRAVRERLRPAFHAADEAAAARIVNEVLADASASPVLERDESAWHVRFDARSGRASDRVAVVAAMGIAAVMTDLGEGRLGVCRADNCRDVFVDTSRNRSRRYCNDTCSSRTNVAAYRARNRSAAR